MFQSELHEVKVVQYCVGRGTWRVKADSGASSLMDSVEVR
jgi:hypothetical protein